VYWLFCFILSHEDWLSPEMKDSLVQEKKVNRWTELDKRLAGQE
jgi:hypothetical protein